MGKFLGFLFFVSGLAAIYLWGVRPLTQSSPAANTPIQLVAHGHPTPIAVTDAQRSVGDVAQRFLDRWHAGAYTDMYGLLTAQAQGRISQQQFVARYRAVLAEATASSVDAMLQGIRVDPPEATVAFSVTVHTAALGAISQVNRMQLLYIQGHWGVDWYPALIFKQLEDPYVVHLQVLPARRGAIMDRHGQPLAEDGQFVQIGVEPSLVNDEPLLLNYMSHWLHIPSKEIKHLYTLSWAQPDFFMPITTITKPQLDTAPQGLAGVENDGMLTELTDGRIYPQGSVASILVGYVDRTTGHGVAGLERSLDTVLSGHDGLSLEVMNHALTMSAATIASRPAVNGHDVRLTIDLAAQREAERSLGIRPGAAVALDPTNGQVLVLASTPGYDPNRFEVGATTRGIGPVRSMFPRATLGVYPSGSIFKIVTMAAALERGGYRADSMIDGPGVWYGLGANHPLHDWLQTGHGTISLQEALTQSCDTCFYQVAQKLDGIDENILPQFARAFGFGGITGIDDVTEAPGLVGDNAWKQKTYYDAWRTGDSVNLSIGQGYFLATPLQVAAMLAAVADGGKRHTPSLVLSIDGAYVHHVQTQVAGTLPVSGEHLKTILAGMLGVTTEPTGTATFVFRGFPWQVAGKTGTAQNPGGQAHAWFGAVAPAAQPRIALAVVVENGGEGSYVAAPVARNILRVYLPEVGHPRAPGPQQLTVPSN